MKTLTPAAARLLARLKKDGCINRDRLTKKMRAAIAELNHADFFVQTEHPIHEGYWITYYPDRKTAR